jgi:hypothetical protein
MAHLITKQFADPVGMMLNVTDQTAPVRTPQSPVDMDFALLDLTNKLFDLSDISEHRRLITKTHPSRKFKPM